MAYDDIALFRADEGAVRARTGSGEYLTDYTLGDLEHRMGGAFARPNRSELVNLSRIERIASNGDGSATLTLKDGTSIHVTRRRAAEVRRQLEQ
jgi:DNA-binding LytR/AlgR family response regulator